VILSVPPFLLESTGTTAVTNIALLFQSFIRVITVVV
jgi:hypothetical protein